MPCLRPVRPCSVRSPSPQGAGLSRIQRLRRAPDERAAARDVLRGQRQRRKGLGRSRIPGLAQEVPDDPDARHPGAARCPAAREGPARQSRDRRAALARSRPPAKGRRGRVEKPDAHSLHERVAKHEDALRALCSRPGRRLRGRRRRTGDPDGQDVRALPDPGRRRGVAPHPGLPRLNEGARAGSPRRPPDRACRQGRRGRAARRPVHA